MTAGDTDEKNEIRRLTIELALAEKGIYDAVSFFIPAIGAAFLIGLGLGVLGALAVFQ